MSQTSFLGYYERQDPDHMDEDYPVSALRTFLLANNAAHLIDEFVQTHMNFVSSTSGDQFIAPGAYGTLIYAFEFPHTWFETASGEIEPAGLYLKVSGDSDTDTTPLFLRVRCVPAHTTLGDLTAPSLIDESADTGAGETVTIEEYFAADDFDEEGVKFARESFGSKLLRGYTLQLDEGGEFVTIRQDMMRLEVHMSETDNTTDEDHLITELLLRESA